MDEPYCNGALRSHTDYFVKIRAYSVANIAMETEWVSVNGLVDEAPKGKGFFILSIFKCLDNLTKN